MHIDFERRLNDDITALKTEQKLHLESRALKILSMIIMEN